ncbi:HEAT repeat domain-containing protein [Methanotrichaceae archaeon M04Ac]|uniref:HEAT repeat domain-containing protein n=1 Tax=Candidatus Methanocrinis alkalitolerans TaxID=3033395 RepID=A0ABT5XHR8_9EURY|nr:HEAT repeat domain-containing protein [Candidatus Methanocrinis alkalitolerans]
MLVVLAALVMPAAADEVDDLILGLKYGTVDTRLEAVKLLCTIEDPRAVDPLIEALNDTDPSVQAWAASALVRLGKTEYIDHAISVLRIHPSAFVISGDIAWSLKESLKESRATVARARAARALGASLHPMAVDPLIEALQDEDWGVRAEAAIALGEIGDAKAIDPLAKALLKDNFDPYHPNEISGNIQIRRSAAEALGKIGDKRAVQPLIEALKDESWHVRSTAAWALGEIGDPSAIEPLTYWASKGNHGAAEALEKIRAE